MSDTLYYIICAVLVIGVLVGISMMSKVKTASKGNLLSALSMAAAIFLTLYKYEILNVYYLWAAMAAGLVCGIYFAGKIKMIEMPQVVALLNGFGGAASALVAAISMQGSSDIGAFGYATGALALVVGCITLTGSLVAAGKLHKVLTQKSVVWKDHQVMITLSVAVTLLTIVLTVLESGSTLPWIILCALASGFFGIAFSVRVGGADMPITISLLNSLSGVAGSIAGMAINDPLLVAIGGVVGASGLLLTQIMCKSMNRSLKDILLGKTSAPAKKVENTTSTAAPSPAVEEKTATQNEDNNSFIKEAKKVIIVPGYGMALAQAQQLVKQVADKYEDLGAVVDYAIHPVAGRMPGHMNVLLAEADVPYEKLREMEDINPEFGSCDLAIVIGANDVVNPAANTAEGTPIYGMPVLDVEKAKHIIICNFDKKPGYAGVDNPLYDMPNATLMLGDAGETLKELLGILNGSGAKQAVSTPSQVSAQDDSFIKEAKKVIIVPGYGMALAQAQQLVKQVADKYEDLGAIVDYAIHPVAGRMPGHMNVLLAEADVPYEKLREMDDINLEFGSCDLAIVIGANDVVNPAANTAEGTPIYGMPVLDVEKAKHIIICNFDKKPGYAGVENPLYDMPNATLMLGDAGETLKELLGILNGSGAKQAASTPSQGSAQDDSFIKEAKKVIIVPGYGMALAQAQQLVKQVADKYEDLGAVVDYAIHPVAGRMPGHMNVLLAEADVPYEKLREMDDINPEFSGCDLAIVIGANDVVNPAANTAEGTPIYGMPVLDVEKAKHIIICNFDKKPGYAGVENPLYDMPNATLMLGDAGETLKELLGILNGSGAKQAVSASSQISAQDDSFIKEAKKVIIVPGYGMALAQAQQLVKQVADKYEDLGAVVDYAIHPVAGRMPGHMNVLLAEADVPYEKLREMEDINPEFDGCDLAIVIGANDVVNPAANTAEGTPIYGMPVLDVEKAKHIIICNFDKKPGYAGVDNPLYDMPNATLMLGDAGETLKKLLGKLQ